MHSFFGAAPDMFDVGIHHKGFRLRWQYRNCQSWWSAAEVSGTRCHWHGLWGKRLITELRIPEMVETLEGACHESQQSLKYRSASPVPPVPLTGSGITFIPITIATLSGPEWIKNLSPWKKAEATAPGFGIIDRCHLYAAEQGNWHCCPLQRLHSSVRVKIGHP